MLQHKLHGGMAEPATPVVEKDHRQIRSTCLPILVRSARLPAIIRKQNHFDGNRQRTDRHGAGPGRAKAVSRGPREASGVGEAAAWTLRRSAVSGWGGVASRHDAGFRVGSARGHQRRHTWC
jgi:hypothetical protein